jgi:tetratricopeptide (TPR) repeat protein
MVIKARFIYARLAKTLAAEGKNEKAMAVLNSCLELLPPEKFPYDPYFTDLIEGYFAAGDSGRAVQLARDLSSYYFARLDYFLKQNPYVISSAEYEIQSAIQYTSKAATLCEQHGQKEIGEELNGKLEEYYAEYVGKQRVSAP